MGLSSSPGDVGDGTVAVSPERSTDPSATESTDASPRVRWRRLALLVATVVAASIAYSFLSWIRYEGFFPGTWDLGINMQLLWTNTHGSLLFEAADYETSRANSFLYVHLAFVALPISYLYLLMPTASMLYALQAVMVASAIVPLYLIGRRAQVPEGILYGGLAVYLASLPVLAGYLFDYHWEAFIPVEVLCTYYLWVTGRYRWALVPAALGVLTLEVFPILLVGMVLYFAVPYVVGFFRGPHKYDFQRVWSAVRGPALPLVGLLIFAAVGFLIPYLVGRLVLPPITGEAPIYPSTGSASFLGYSLWSVTLPSLGPRLLYWFLLVASFGFLPLLFRRRLLILSLPWFVYSVVMTQNYVYTRFGFQYSMIAIAPLAIGFIEGLGVLVRSPSRPSRARMPASSWWILLIPLLAAALTESVALITATPEGVGVGLILALVALGSYGAMWFVFARARRTTPSATGAPFSLGRRARNARALVVVGIVVLIGSNLALSPLNPTNFLGPGEAGYSFSYSTSPTYPYMAGVTAEIPSGASVVASANLFPFVANDRNAYSLLWFPGVPPYFPFNAARLPDFVLVSTSEWFALPFLNAALANQSEYGLRTLLYSSIFYPGSVFLFQLGFTGPTDIVHVTPFPPQTTLCGSDLALGPSGVVVSAVGSRCGTIVESHPAANLSGNGPVVWYGPYATLIPGNYTVTISLEGELSGPGSGDVPIVIMNAEGLGTGYFYSVVISAHRVSLTQWTNFTYGFQLTRPVSQAEWRGFLGGVMTNGTFVPGFVRLNYIEVDYLSGASPAG